MAIPPPTLTARNLCLHYVARPGERRRLALPPDDLAAMVRRELAAGRRPASLADYLHAQPPGADRFTLSFDDAHRSVLTHALPLLRTLEVPATLFVPTAYVAMSDEFLDWDELRSLRDAGWTLGSHTVTHPRMSWRLHGETDAAYLTRLDDECARSRELLQRELSLDVALFAYPYGESPDAAREAARRAGYDAAFTVRESSAWDGDPFTIPRVEALEAHGYIAPAASEPVAFSVVVPACDRPEILAEVLRRLAAQSYPPERYEVIVVDDGSRTDLAPLFRDAPPHLRLIAGAGERGTFRAGRARQRGAREARYNTLAFLDADVAVGRDFLWHLDWVHQRTPRAVVLGYLSGYNLHDLGRLHTPESVRTLADLGDLDALPVIPDRSREPTLRACLDNLDWLDAPWKLAYTGNLSVARDLFDDIGGFADEFAGWGLEDVDLGYRLHRAGATWVFSRFAVGYHLVDPTESTPRNPFRMPSPTREHFGGYLANLATLRQRHAGDAAMEEYHARALADIDETCGQPDTVGIEFGGESSLRCRFHRVLHRCQPGGVPAEELLDRVAYAGKVGARSVYLLGGEPAEHPAFLDVIAASRRAGVRWIGLQTSAVPFAADGLAARARAAGLDHATVEVFAFGESDYEAITRVPGSYARFMAGLASLGEAGIHRSARVLVTAGTLCVLEATLNSLVASGVAIDEVAVVDPALLAGTGAAVTAWAGSRGVPPPPVVVAAP